MLRRSSSSSSSSWEWIPPKPRKERNDEEVVHREEDKKWQWEIGEINDEQIREWSEQHERIDYNQDVVPVRLDIDPDSYCWFGNVVEFHG